MPSIGGIETSSTKDRELEDVTSLISVEIGGLNSSSTPKSTAINTPLKDKPLKTEAPIMAPNKNGQVDNECKTSTQAMSDPASNPIKPDKKPGDPPAATENGAERKGQDSCHGNDVKSEEQVDMNGTGESDDVVGIVQDEQMEKTAEVKRKEYKEKPRASSVELLGLKKKFARIPNQGQLNQKVKESAESELKRRKSSPATYHYPVRSQRIPEEQSREDACVHSLATKMTQMDLSDQKKDGFGKRMEEEKGNSNLVSKGPTRHGPTQPRTHPYTVGQAGMAYVNVQPCQPQQQVHHSSVARPVYPCSTQRPCIIASDKKVRVPGMPPEQQIILTDGRTLQSLSRPQTVVSRKDPVESCWPPSPTDSSYPNSPGSAPSLSPGHTMQQTPSPAYSPAYSPAQPQPSPQSMMSPAGSYHEMSTSPNSPLSPEMMVMVNSPPSVQSEDSGISSPPHNHNVYNYTSLSGTNSGTVIDNCQRPYRESQIPVDNLQYIIQNKPHQPPQQQPQQLQQQQQPQQLQQQQQQHQPPSQDEVDQQRIKEIQDQLMASEISYIQLDNTAHLGPQQVHYHQGYMRQPPVYRDVQMTSVQTGPMQVITPPPTPQDQVRNLENLVNNMPLDVLCSLDEDGDTALHIAISQGSIQLVHAIVNRLLKSGRKDALNLRDNLGQTPLHICMVTNQPDLIVCLLQAGADLMIPNKEQVTVLHYAATKGYSHALLAIGHCYLENMISRIDIDCEDKNGMSPLQCAIHAHGRLARVYDGSQCMYVDKMVDSLDTIRNLLHLGADPSFQDRRSGYTTLHFAVELAPSKKVTMNTFIIKIILEWPGVDARQLLKMPNYAGNTPLHLIAGRDYDEDYVVSVIDHLLSFGADIDLKNLEKQTPRDLINLKKNEKPKVYARLQGDHLQGK